MMQRLELWMSGFAWDSVCTLTRETRACGACSRTFSTLKTGNFWRSLQEPNRSSRGDFARVWSISTISLSSSLEAIFRLSPISITQRCSSTELTRIRGPRLRVFQLGDGCTPVVQWIDQSTFAVGGKKITSTMIALNDLLL